MRLRLRLEGQDRECGFNFRVNQTWFESLGGENFYLIAFDDVTDARRLERAVQDRSAALAETERLKFLVAFRPGLVPPTLAAQQAATFQRFSGGRLLLNVVSGVGKVSLTDVTRGLTPFLIALTSVLLLLVAFPALVLVPMKWFL